MDKTVAVRGVFDALSSREVRFFQEASGLGRVHLFLEDDDTVRTLYKRDPEFSLVERKYFWEAVRFIDAVTIVSSDCSIDELPLTCVSKPGVWCLEEDQDSKGKRAFCREKGIGCTVIQEDALKGFPVVPVEITRNPEGSGKKMVIVTGCYDYFHSGHVRFFEEVSQFGNLYVVVGSDANVRLLKGEGHPMYSEEERRYMAGSIKYVTQAFVSTGKGWLDAEPEIRKIKPDIYAVNEEGDKPEKRNFCEETGIEYVVLKRAPKEGLPRRTSTNLRGF